MRPSCLHYASFPPARSAQQTFLAFCVGTLFLNTESGLVNNNVSDGLSNANLVLGVLFFSCLSL
jgi:hypothetical protein